jgi:ferredoxin
MRIIADRDTCVGAGNCVLTAPALFDQDDELGLVLVREATPSADQHALARQAAHLCPSGAIRLTED